MNTKEQYSILYEAYKHYQKTGDKHFDVTLYNSDYAINALNICYKLKENGYIENVSEKLLIDECPSHVTYALTPEEPLSFDITSKGIHFIASQEL